MLIRFLDAGGDTWVGSGGLVLAGLQTRLAVPFPSESGLPEVVAATFRSSGGNRRRRGRELGGVEIFLRIGCVRLKMRELARFWNLTG